MDAQAPRAMPSIAKEQRSEPLFSAEANLLFWRIEVESLTSQSQF